MTDVDFDAVWSDVEGSSSTSEELSHLYNQFYSGLDQLLKGLKNRTATKALHATFTAIIRLEIGEPFCHSATFSPKISGSVQLQIDWRYLYLNRHFLERNWRNGFYRTIQLNGAPDAVQPNQREGIYCVYFDRKYLAAGSRDKSIRLWRMDGLEYDGKLESHEGSVLCLQLDSDKGIIISGSSDSTIKIWDIETRQVIQTLYGHKESVLGLHYEGNHIVSCSKDTTALIWSICEDGVTVGRTAQSALPSQEIPRSSPNFTHLHTLKGHRAAVNSVHFLGNTIATASGDRTVRLWNLSTGTMIRTLGAHARGIACVNIVGGLVVTGSSDHVIKVFDMASGEEIRTLRGHNGLVRTIQTDKTKIISGSYDQSIRIWDLNTGEMLQELASCHDSKYISAKLFPQADFVVGYFACIEINDESYPAAGTPRLWFGISPIHPKMMWFELTELQPLTQPFFESLEKPSGF